MRQIETRLQFGGWEGGQKNYYLTAVAVFTLRAPQKPLSFVQSGPSSQAVVSASAATGAWSLSTVAYL